MYHVKCLDFSLLDARDTEAEEALDTVGDGSVDFVIIEEFRC